MATKTKKPTRRQYVANYHGWLDEMQGHYHGVTTDLATWSVVVEAVQLAKFSNGVMGNKKVARLLQHFESNLKTLPLPEAVRRNLWPSEGR